MAGLCLSRAPFTTVAVYAPNCKQLTFLDSVLQSVILQGGPARSRRCFQYQPRPTTRHVLRPLNPFVCLSDTLWKSLQAHHFVDCWRLLHPTDRDYSYFSATHNVYTRIDFMLMNQYSLDFLAGASIGSITISDHAPVSISLHPLSMEART